MKTALVTGGHKRLGRAIALGLAHAGWDVAVHYRQDGALADAVVDEIRGLGRRAVAIQAELTEDGDVARLVHKSVTALGGLSLLVLSAASYHPTPIGTLTPAQIDRALAENARAPVAVALAARTALEASGDGRIVVLGDLAAQLPYAGYLAHSMAKSALHAAVRGLAVELAPAITVNAVVPGAVLRPDDLPQPAWNRLLDLVPQGRQLVADPAAGPAAIAEAVLHFAQCSRYITGTFALIDGGRTARW